VAPGTGQNHLRRSPGTPRRARVAQRSGQHRHLPRLCLGTGPFATGDGNCDWGPRYHGNMGDPDVPTASARWVVTYRNAGGTACALRQVTRVFID
jgi:ABC-type uncharacterized transport system, permease component